MDTFRLVNQSTKQLLLLNLEDVWAAAHKWYLDNNSPLGPYRLYTKTKRVYLRDELSYLIWQPGVNPQSPLTVANSQPIGNASELILSALMDHQESTEYIKGYLSVFYKNGLVYDNRRENIGRIVLTKEQDGKLLNGYKSAYRGVTWDSARSRWVTQVYYKSKRVHCSYHTDELMAALKFNEVGARYGKKLNEIAH